MGIDARSIALTAGVAIGSLLLVRAVAGQESLIDPFGITKLYPSGPGGPQWYSTHWHNGHMRNLTQGEPDQHDPTGWSSHQGGQRIILPGNGEMIWDRGGPGIDPRFYIDPTGDRKFFKNVEITGYQMVSQASPLSQGFTFGCRGALLGHAPDGDHCMTTTYYARVTNHNGDSLFLKELIHPEVGAESLVPVFPQGGRPVGQWLGMKFICYNVGDHVRLEHWLDFSDGDNGGHWFRFNQFVDDGSNFFGGLSPLLDQCMERGLFPDGEFSVIRESHGTVFTRDTEVNQARFKWFSAREIQI